MKIPIVIVAFGTTTKAIETYSYIDEIFKDRFPDHEILWAYSSRMVKDWIKERRNIELKHPHQVLADLEERGHSWAVVQSLHLLCGHEFYRLVQEVASSDIRTAMGLPLLSSPEDYAQVVGVVGNDFREIEKDEAVVLVGHGTDHPIWSAYLAIHHMFQERFGKNVHVGVVEGHPHRDKIIREVNISGIRKVRLVPFMLVAGTHFNEDLSGREDSWKACFEKIGISVSVETKALGYYRGLIDIFCRHTREALDVIPYRT